MNATVTKLYLKARSQGWPASAALHRAKTITAWDEHGGEIVGESSIKRFEDVPQDGNLVRIVEHVDDASTALDFDGTERQHKEAAERANRDGVWAYVAQHWDGNQWAADDSIWGFIGDDFKGSGYDSDLMQAAMDGLDAEYEAMARALEASRPDMYSYLAGSR